MLFRFSPSVLTLAGHIAIAIGCALTPEGCDDGLRAGHLNGQAARVKERDLRLSGRKNPGLTWADETQDERNSANLK